MASDALGATVKTQKSADTTIENENLRIEFQKPDDLNDTEEALFSLASSYPLLPGKGVLLNLIGIFLTVFTATVTFIATKSSFKPLD